LKRRLMTAVVAVAAMAGLGLGGTAPAAASGGAAGTVQAGDIGTTAAVLGHVCDGPWGTTATFTITSQGGIPAGSTWELSASNVGTHGQLLAVPDHPAISTRALSRFTVELRAESAIPNGTVIRVSPWYYVVDWRGTVLRLSGYGGSHEMRFTMDNPAGPCRR
jgi:hypothetical protein